MDHRNTIHTTIPKDFLASNHIHTLIFHVGLKLRLDFESNIAYLMPKDTNEYINHKYECNYKYKNIQKFLKITKYI